MRVELLAPARDAATARQAILHGADAVYMGGPSHGARAAAANTLADIEATARFAHLYKARLYVTLNTLVYPSELAAVEREMWQLYEGGADALIIQDMGLLGLDLPPIELHASTQCDIRTPERARMLAAAGMSRLVVPRELTLDETAAMRRALPPEVELEAFVHGALCVSYSGDCRASEVKLGRSANRGCCAQLCRLPYRLVDADTGRDVAPERHYLSLRDLNRSGRLADMLRAGVNSFKIEGRLKDAAYVKNVVGHYRRALDAAMETVGGCERLSVGTPRLAFEPSLADAFNRGFTDYFTAVARPVPGPRMAALDTPKSVGSEIGRVTAADPQGRWLEARLHAGVTLANGDGLAWLGADGRLEGCRANRVEGCRIYTAAPARPPVGAVLRRNHNRVLERRLEGETAERPIAVDAALAYADGTLTLTLADEGGRCASASVAATVDSARTPQTERMRQTVGKLGGTPWQLRRLDTSALPPDAFIAASVLTALRRDAVDALMRQAAERPIPPALPQPSVVAVESLGPEALNIANPLAERFYAERGVTPAQAPEAADPTRVMTTRYCLRRELGCCLLTPDADRLPRRLRLKGAGQGMEFDLRFDCADCRMHVHTVSPADS